jgi:hypothetical protein
MIKLINSGKTITEAINAIKTEGWNDNTRTWKNQKLITRI